MTRLALALALVSSAFVSVAHAVPMGIVAPAPGATKRYLKAQFTAGKATPIKTSAAHNSQYYKFTSALAAKPSAFRALKLINALDYRVTAYVPKVYMKALAGNTAYVKATDSMAGTQGLSKIALPLF